MALQEMQERQYPKPLTVEQLKNMIGEPVWVQPPDMPEYGMWGIVENADVRNSDQILWLRGDFTRDGLGKTWLVYKNIPKEAENV